MGIHLELRAEQFGLVEAPDLSMRAERRTALNCLPCKKLRAVADRKSVV